MRIECKRLGGYMKVICLSCNQLKALVEDAYRQIENYRNQIESYKRVEANDSQLIADLMDHIDYLNAQLNQYKLRSDNNDRSRRSVCKLRKVTKNL